MKKFIFCFLILASLAVKGEQIIWDGKSEVIRAGHRLEILTDKEGNMNISQVSDSGMADQFRKSDQEILHFDFSGSAYWLKFSLQNKTSDTLLLVLAQAVLPSADLYFKNNDGQWQCIKAGYTVNMNDKLIRHHYQVYPLSAGAKEYYLRLVSFSPPVPVFIWKEHSYRIVSDNQKMYYGLYAGILLFVILYNMFLAFSLRIFTYMHYALVVILYLVISACVMDGYVLYFFPNANLTFLYSFAPSLAMVVSSLYAIFFLEVKKYVPGIYPYALGVVLYFAVYMLGHIFMPQPVVLVLNQFNALVSLLFMFYLGIKVGRQFNKLGYYFALAYFIYLIIVVTEVVYIQTGTPAYLFGLSHVSIAIMMEAIILAYLLSRRFNWEKEEIQFAKDVAQSNLLKITQEKEQLAHNQNIRLEETVKQRTSEIEQQKEIVEKTLSEKEGLLHEKEILLKEIHHRVKNNLQTISSMLMLQSSGLKDEQAKKAIAESQNRVRSIALVHQKLYQTDGLEKVELNTFITDLAEQVKSFYRGQSKSVSIRLMVPQTNILIDAAVPLGLMLNELLTNSFKYAFVEPVEGLIEIELLEIDNNNDKKEKTFKLIYRDSGKGLESTAAIEKPVTMGLRLIRLLSLQIGAKLDYSNTNGSEFVFTFNVNL